MDSQKLFYKYVSSSYQNTNFGKSTRFVIKQRMAIYHNPDYYPECVSVNKQQCIK